MRLMDPASETWVAFTSMNVNFTELSWLSIGFLVGCPHRNSKSKQKCFLKQMDQHGTLRASWVKTFQISKNLPGSTLYRMFHFPPLKKKR